MPTKLFVKRHFATLWENNPTHIDINPRKDPISHVTDISVHIHIFHLLLQITTDCSRK